MLERFFVLLLEFINKPLNSGFKKINIGNNKISIHSEKGNIREDNEDRVAFAVIENRAFKGADLAVGILADGMGGMREGAFASSITIAAFVSYITLSHSEFGIKELGKNALNYANMMVKKHLHGKGGSTLSVIIYGEKGSAAINIGDSRIYDYKDNKLTQLTIDDTILGQIKNEIEDVDSWIDPFKADTRLAQHLGMEEPLEPHLLDLSEKSIEEHDKGFYLITSDGAHYLGMPMLQQLMNKCQLQENISSRIVQTADWLGGHDNATVAVMPKRFEFTDTQFANKNKQEECIRIRFYGILNESVFLIPKMDFTDSVSPGKKKSDIQLELFQKKDSDSKDKQERDIAKKLEKKPKQKRKKRKPQKKRKEPVEKNKKDEVDASLNYISLKDEKDG